MIGSFKVKSLPEQLQGGCRRLP